ncbi:hypothetical protein IRJ41_006817 [Triplophysa rosa]|uniref:Uncharacterized protein n=1 Tax=Triplophysa rosa TaxID=992332 RepID=A0A9W7WSQ1_TRIRA|nr:hypothetical protein IRJ41_006817 [Triplophysa rosa]
MSHCGSRKGDCVLKKQQSTSVSRVISKLSPTADRDGITTVDEEEEEGPTQLTLTAEDKKTESAEKCSI